MGTRIVFVDTSGIVAILGQESDGPELSAKLQGADHAITAPHVLLESVMVLTTLQKLAPTIALRSIEELLESAAVDIVPITAEIARAAIDAFARYGKGRGHPAQLNFGDCLSYGSARAHGVPLLFKGDDFASTDIVRA